jgi:hypothetical protein
MRNQWRALRQDAPLKNPIIIDEGSAQGEPADRRR